MYAVMAQSWNFIGGLAGYPSFATAAFFGFGAYTSAILQNHGAPMMLSWGCAGLAAMTFAAFLGGAILHLRGHYFAIASLIVAEMLREIVNGMPDFTGGGKGLNLPILPHFGDGAGAVLLLRHAGARADLHGRGHRHSSEQARLRPALHPAERGCGQHPRRQRLRLQDRGVFAVRRVRRRRRRDLCLMGEVHRAARRVRRAARRQADGDGAARRARHDLRPGAWRRHSAGLRGAGVAQLPHHPCGGARSHHRRADPVHAERHSGAGAELVARARWPDDGAADARQRVAAVRRPQCRRWRQLLGREGRDCRPDRAERRRQDHAHQPDHRRPSRHEQAASASKATTSRARSRTRLRGGASPARFRSFSRSRR